MSRSQEVLGVDGRLLALEDRLTLESVLEPDRLWPPVTGLLRLDCVCSCLKDCWLIVKMTVAGYPICLQELHSSTAGSEARCDR
jgi:hypothetical protein